MQIDPNSVQWDDAPAPVRTAPTSQSPGVIRGAPSASKQAAEERANQGQQNDAVRLDIASSSEARAGRDEGFDNAAKLRDEFRKAPESVNYEVVMRQFSSALGAQPTPTGDQALITAYAKMLDPGSVVREQEFNTVAAGDSKLGSIVARLQKEFGVDDSGLIRPEVRNRVLTEMKNLSDNYRQSYDRVRTDYEGLAKKYNLDPSLVAGTRVDEPYSEKVQKTWAERFPQGSDAVPVAITGGESYSTDQDKAIAAAVQSAFQQGGGVQELKAAAEQAGAQIRPEDLASFQQAIEARDKKQAVTFNPKKSGTRSPLAQFAGEAAMTPVGTAVTGAVNAAGLGVLSQFAGDQVQGLEALNPKSAFVGEAIGSAIGTGALAAVGRQGIGRVTSTLVERLAGGGMKGALARTAATDAAYGGIYAANTGEDIGTGVALGALGSLVGAGVGAGVKRAAPAFRGMFRGNGDEVLPPFDGGPGGGSPPKPADQPSDENLLDEFNSWFSNGGNDAATSPTKNTALGEISVKDGEMNQKFYTSESGARISIMEDSKWAPRKNSVTDFVVPDEVQRQGLGGQLLDDVLSRYDPKEISAAASSDTSVALFYKRGFRPISKPDARLKDALDMRREDSSVTMVIPEGGKFTPKSKPKSALVEEPFVPRTVRSNDAGASGTSGEAMRLSQAEGLPVPVELTRGAAARDADQLAFEEEQIFGPLGAPLRTRAEENNLQVLQNFDRFIDLTGAQAPDIPSTGNAVIKALSQGYKQAKDRVKVAYKRAEVAGDMAEPVSYKEIADYIAEQTPTTREKLAPILNAVSEQLRKNDPDGTGQIPINALEDVRKLINKATTPGTADANYGGELKGLIDQATEGKGGALYKKARALRIEQARKFENRAVVERLVASVKNKADAKTTSEEVFRKSILNESPEDIKFLRHALKTSGKDGRQAWKELQGATIRHIQDAATSNVNLTSTNEKVVSAAALNKAVTQLDANGRLDAVFDPTTAQRIRDLRDVVQYVNTVPPGTSINNSGTARTLVAYMTAMGAEAGGMAALTGMPVPVLTAMKALRGVVKDNRIKKKISQSLIPKNSMMATQMGENTIN